MFKKDLKKLIKVIMMFWICFIVFIGSYHLPIEPITKGLILLFEAMSIMILVMIYIDFDKISYPN